MGWVVHEEKKTQKITRAGRRAPEMKQEAELAKNKSDGGEANTESQVDVL